MNKIKGRDVLFWRTSLGEMNDLQLVGLSTNATIDAERAMIEIAPTLSGVASEFIPGKYNWMVSCERMVVAETLGSDIALLTGGTKLLIFMGIEDPTIPLRGIGVSGEAYVEKVQERAPLQGMATVAITLRGTGPLRVHTGR